MLLVIVGKRYRYQYQNRYDVHQDNTETGQSQQCNMKFFIE